MVGTRCDHVHITASRNSTSSLQTKPSLLQAHCADAPIQSQCIHGFRSVWLVTAISDELQDEYDAQMCAAIDFKNEDACCTYCSRHRRRSIACFRTGCYYPRCAGPRLVPGWQACCLQLARGCLHRRSVRRNRFPTHGTCRI